MLEKNKVVVVREDHTKEEGSHRSGGWSRESMNINLENGVKTAGRESFDGSESVSCNESRACRKVKRRRKRRVQQQRMKIMKEMMRKIRAKGRMDANNSGWVGDLLAADCERDTLQKWKNWLHEMKKKDEVKKMEEEH